MDALPEFEVLRPKSLDDVVKARAAHADSRMLGGGTDLVVNIRRGIVAPPVLIDVNGVAELRAIKADAQTLEIGASVTLAELAEHQDVVAHYPVVAQAAAHIAGPTHRHMGTVGGNLCLDTRCIYYNQSEWWRAANHHCLKTTGEICHVAPKSRGVCFATYSGDLAPALLTLGADVDLAGPQGRRTVPLASLYIGHARQDQPVTETMGDGKFFLALRPGEFVTAVRANNTPGLRSGYDKLRIRRSIEYPVAGVAVALRRDGDTLADLRVAFTGTNPRPVLLEGTAALCGGPLDERVFKGLDALVRDQIMAMKTTFTPGHYRRRVAGVLARRLVSASVRTIAPPRSDLRHSTGRRRVLPSSSTRDSAHASFRSMTNRSPVDPHTILFQGVGTWDAIAVAVAGMAPTLAMNLNPQEPAEHVGRVVPLVFALSTLVVLLVAWCFARLARDHPNAGSAYGFVGAILGPRAGLVAGWTLFGTYLCFAIVGLGAFGLFGADLLQRAGLWHGA